MIPVFFEGSKEIKRPESMTDDQCMSVWAIQGTDTHGFYFFIEAWKPSYEDIQAINRGEPIYIKIVHNVLPPIAMFTLDEKGEVNE